MPNKSPRLIFFLALCGFAVCLAVPANAVPIIFSGDDPGANSTDPRPNSDAAAASFDAAASALGTNTIINFESAPVGSFSSLLVAPGVTITGADFLSSDQTIRNSPFDNPEELFGYNTTSGGSNFVYVNGGTLTFTFSTPIESFGAYFSGVQDPVFGSLTLTFNDGSDQTIPFIPLGADGGVEFLGFTDAGAMITSVTINAFDDFIGVDDVRFQVVPEPSTWAMFGVGAVMLCGMMRFRRRLG